MAKIGRHEVDFGASDVIGTPVDLKKNDLVMFPTVITGVVPVVNLPKIGSNALRLNGDVLARIFLGQITQWDAPEIRALNVDLKLPSHPIRLIARSDGSGTTYHFSDYLSRTSDAWKSKYGVANHFAWPAGTLAVKGSGEVSKTRARHAGFDLLHRLQLRGRRRARRRLDEERRRTVRDSRRRVLPRSRHAQRLVLGRRFLHRAEQPRRQQDVAVDDGHLCRRIPRIAPAGARTEGALRFITWAYLHGDTLARQARFVPLPEKVQASAYREITRVYSENGEMLGAKLMGRLVN